MSQHKHLQRRLLLPAMLGAVLFSTFPAGAQYYDPYRRPPPSYDNDDEYEAPARPYGYGYGRRYYRPAYGNLCVTGRGDCPTPALPYGSSCGCYIPGFGNKRGVVQ
ncbi:hypothetical protein ACXIUS_14065 [Bosea thiooxidans]|nr:hypothetical protein [Bosea sp. (in: a-proteobacteria)]